MYVKCGSARKQRKCCSEFIGNTVPSIRCIHNIVNKVRYTGSLLDNKPAKKNCVIPKKTRRNWG
jgi:hypothetical protein